MRNLLIAACCVALVGSIPVASAQTTGPAAPEAVKSHNPMNSNAKMKKKHKKSTKAEDGMTKDGTKKDTK
jgi:hypothetical protein